LARLIAEHLGRDWNQTVVVENRPGGATMIGTQAVISSPPDGYTLLLGNTNISINPSLQKSMPYDADKQLAPVALINLVPTLFLVHPDVPVKSIKELIALAKANPGKLNYSHGGHGSFPHLAVELFKALAKVDITAVPFTGAAPALNAILGKHVDLIDNDIPTALAQVQEGKLRALAITSDARVKTLPDVPTMVEAGVPGYEAVAWQGIFVPAGTPKPIVDKLNAAIVKALAAPNLKDIFAKQGIDGIPPWTPEEFGAFLKKETVRWKGAIEAAGIKSE
jgi:tripartite-type tricarboxylate transporter receptor subunit TctC